METQLEEARSPRIRDTLSERNSDAVVVKISTYNETSVVSFEAEINTIKRLLPIVYTSQSSTQNTVT